MLLGLSCIFTAIPYFIYGPVDLTTDSLDSSLVSKPSVGQMCLNDAANLDFDCSDGNQGTTVWPAVIILFWASFFRGAGFTG